jgi:hypothetical protein
VTTTVHHREYTFIFMSSQSATSRTPLLPQQVHDTHNLSRSPVRFPAGAESSKRDAAEAPRALPHPHTSEAEEEWRRAQTGLVPVNKSGLPKLSRECLRSEIQCYGKYIVATLLVFGVGGVLLAFFVVKRR